MIGIQRDVLIKNQKLDKFLGVVRSIFLFFFLFSLALFVIRNYSDVLTLAEAFGPLLTCALATAKIFTFTASKPKFYRIIDQVKKLSTRGKIDVSPVSIDFLKTVHFK